MLSTNETLSMSQSSSDIPSAYDPLTGLYNKALFIQVMASLLCIARRQHMPVSLLIVNIDYDNIVDEYSLSDTKNLLKESADLIKSVLRDSDTLAYFEEDKFAVLLYNCDNKSTTIPIQRLRNQLESKLIIGDKKVGITFGFSTFGENYNSDRGRPIKEVSNCLVTNALLSLNHAVDQKRSETSSFNSN
ncbi:GGDEF domain-containing protein [Vibrio algarum]|uniref:GGDEF domain-containing protein n=1 Tax=Vibrio algarum TaxID=3020714 RepID=A0ABT4YNW9_9VIBR|nr:GGDEF domain-containing protein [Vibrio sp. KJ40-1]MDB1123249.1 GGDEF domain-containing protein [Vibrio sp. KJ40-1]